MESRSPQSPKRVVASFPDLGREAVDRVVSEARGSQIAWSSTPAPERARLLHACAAELSAAAPEITALGIAEVGKPRGEMAAEVARGVSILHYYADASLDAIGEVYPAPDQPSLVFVRSRPRGVAGLITPWNFPVAIPLWKAAPALAYGNAAICKPAPAATGVALRLAALLDNHLPPGLFTVITGGTSTAESLLDTADIISFTGSVAAGHSVMARAASRGIPVQAEMGGQNPAIVLPDADVDRAAAAITGAAMGYAGQKCTATSRIIIVGDDRGFTDALLAKVAHLTIGDPADQDTVVGPVISRGALESVLLAASTARAAGGRVLCGGSALEEEGFYVEPTLVCGIEPHHPLAQEEIFGPFALIFSASNVDEAVHIANDVKYGLAASVFTEDLDYAIDVSSRLDAGMIRVNAPTTGVDFYTPFGGVKASSFGPREQGKAARMFYTETQTLTIKPARE